MAAPADAEPSLDAVLLAPAPAPTLASAESTAAPVPAPSSAPPPLVFALAASTSAHSSAGTWFSSAASTSRSASSNESTRTAKSAAPMPDSPSVSSREAPLARSTRPCETISPRVVTALSSRRSSRAESIPDSTSVMPLASAKERSLLKTLTAEPSTPTTYEKSRITNRSGCGALRAEPSSASLRPSDAGAPVSSTADGVAASAIPSAAALAALCATSRSSERRLKAVPKKMKPCSTTTYACRPRAPIARRCAKE
mmetsp:Transcript_12202/g.51395  ORF Transcript_12202/g.51395 Transcript_12202/m.51395 type:complete len:255 (-) Transcript_12202:1335-2099(-)